MAEQDKGYEEVYRSFNEGLRKYIYFLLAAAGAAIGLAVNQTQTATISWSQLPLAFAILCWLWCFFSGCQYLQNVNAFLSLDMETLVAKRQEESRYNGTLENLEKEIEKIRKKTSFWGPQQFWFLIAGAGFYLAWHVAEMVLRSL